MTSVVTIMFSWPYRAPCAALGLWLGGGVGSLTGLLLATCSLAFGLGSPEHRVLRLLVDVVAVMAAWAFVAWVAKAFVAIHRGARKRRERHRALLALFGESVEHLSAVVLPSRQLLAYSVPGPRGGHAVISDSLLTEFTPEEIASVLAHEQAHLKQRHHLFGELSDALRTVLPKRRFTGRFAERFGSLIEMRADCAARTKCGRQATARALARWSGTREAEPVPALDCPVTIRRRHLLASERCCGSLTSQAVFGAALLAAVAPLALITTGGMAAVCRWICH
ncbi:M56 family metallopeptidase [Streptomyces palmae]|uniref:M56 family peptidase n=1 Tax=Streptomyces palmae TaxID=1701085 RepID=A0A4Z0HFG5_9ACTN|nr:M56 family metallopeptidase [Streptomyces palmae]TGB18959.1 M56 family peptidase [Streptomyces palmae]